MHHASWLIMIDFDDTQIPTAYRFVEANLKCAQAIVQSLRPWPPQPKEIFAKHYEFDLALVESLGYGFKRYVDAWVRTYWHFATEVRRPLDASSIPIDPFALNEIRNAAEEIYRGPFIPFDGVADTLAALRKDGHRLHVITAGDPAFQLPKIKASGLQPMYASVNVTTRDKRPVMESIVGSRRKRVMMVGDSLRSDIAPAVELGIAAVHVPGDSWTYGVVPLAPGSYHRIGSLLELPALIRTLEEAMPKE